MPYISEIIMSKCVTMLSECAATRRTRKDGKPEEHAAVLADYERQQSAYLAQTGQIVWG